MHLQKHDKTFSSFNQIFFVFISWFQQQMVLNLLEIRLLIRLICHTKLTKTLDFSKKVLILLNDETGSCVFFWKKNREQGCNYQKLVAWFLTPELLPTSLICLLIQTGLALFPLMAIFTGRRKGRPIKVLLGGWKMQMPPSYIANCHEN